MIKRYYADTLIWMDLYENRSGYNNEPFGDFALKLFALIKAKKYKLIITDILIKELEYNYSIEEVNRILKPFEDVIEKIVSENKQKEEARKIAKEKDVPAGDALHAIIARDHKLILITRDKHFKKLKNVCEYYRPEDII